MSGTRAGGPIRCLGCGSVLAQPDPLVSWWLCDDCVLAVDDDGCRIA